MLRKIVDTLSGNVSRDLTFERQSPGFIPYACHYDESTILTKNGELLQIIKVTGFSHEVVGKELKDLRHVLRSAIRDNISSDEFAFWIHTIRRKKDLVAQGEYLQSFCQNLHTRWNDKHQWHSRYVNELYITILHDAKSVSPKDPKTLFGGMSFSYVKKNHFDYLEVAHEKLTGVTDSILQSMQEYGAKKLGVYEHKNVLYSQPLQFFGKLLNLAEVPVPMPVQDISEYIATHKIVFGFNTLEIIGKTGKHFAGMFTVKENHELSGPVLDTFLQMEGEFVITQTMDFIDSKQAVRDFKYLHYVMGVAGADTLQKSSGLEAIVEADKGNVTDYGVGQLTIMMINHDVKELDKQIQEATGIMDDLGVVIVRRDLRLEECFWAQLPGNFSYFSYRIPMHTGGVGGFASLHNFPAGQLDGNLWGGAVTTLHTSLGTPYFFNFHVGNNGHTTIIGPFGSGKTALTNFLISESQKYFGKLFFFDYNRGSKVFIKALGGEYSIIHPSKKNSAYAFNPLLLDDNDINRTFVYEWLLLLAQADGTVSSQSEKEHVQKIVNFIYQLPKEKRQLSHIAESFGPVKDGSLGQRMSLWYGGGKYAHLFDNDRKSVMPFDATIYGFGMTYVVKDQLTLGPVLFYLLHRIELMLDGAPTMIVLDEAWRLVNNKIFAPKLADWLARLQQKNAMVIFATESVNNASKSEITKVITQNIATQIFLPNERAEESSKAYKNVWGLSSQEYKMLKKMTTEHRHFMVRQGGESIVANLDLSDFPELHILSGGDKTVIMMEEAIREKDDNPDHWLPAFYRRVDG